MALLRMDRTARPAGALMTADGRLIARRARVADRPCARLVGMLGTPDPACDEALLLVPCAAVHGVGMRAAIGVAFLSADGRVLKVVDPLPRRGAACPGAHAVVEAGSGVLRLRPGDRVSLTGARLFPHGAESAATDGGSTGTPGALSGRGEHGAPPDQRRMR